MAGRGITRAADVGGIAAYVARVGEMAEYPLALRGGSARLLCHLRDFAFCGGNPLAFPRRYVVAFALAPLLARLRAFRRPY